MSLIALGWALTIAGFSFAIYFFGKALMVLFLALLGFFYDEETDTWDWNLGTAVGWWSLLLLGYIAVYYLG